MLLTARNLVKHFGPRLLFAGITLGIDEGERIGLIGANGSGKSTLLKIFAGLESADEGDIESKRGLRVAYVAQDDDLPAESTCIDVVADAVDHHFDDHERHVRADVILAKAGFGDGTVLVKTLSGGWRKRLAIVTAMAREPDLMLFDEPTNHLDIEGIEWLEQTIASGKFATLSVSHDRRFLETIGTRIIELDRAYPDGFLSHRGTYSAFIEKREEFLAAQQGRQQALASTVRREIEWLKRGAKARTTKAKGRIDRAGEMMDELADLKSRNAERAAASVDFTASDRRTKKLIELKRVSKSLGGKPLFRDLDLVLSPQKTLGLLGPNGSGKSTLIKLLTDKLQPDSGTVFRAEQLKIVLFDQHREQLDPSDTLRHALSPTGETVRFQNSSMHVNGWARKFLFRTEQLDLPLRELSGGEQARVLIARLMLKEADVLILDEPTNDLDIPTLDVLEESLESFPGAIVLVTHDRYLLDRLSTDILALDGSGNANIYADLSQWEAARAVAKAQATAARKSESGKRIETSTTKKKKLSWNEQKEWDNMESSIHDAEAQLASLQSQLSDPKVLADHQKMTDLCQQVATAQERVETLYARWAELESKQ